MTELSYELTREDFAAFLEFHQQNSPSRRRSLGCLFGLFLGMLLLPAWILLSKDAPILETAAKIWPLLVGPLFFATLSIPYIRWRSRQIRDRLANDGQKAPGERWARSQAE